MLTAATTARGQHGIVLIEALIGILVFTIGIIGLIGLQGTTIALAADAQYRAEASAVAERIVTQIWLGVDRSSLANQQASLQSYRYNTTGANCAFSGGATDTTNAILAAWVASFTTAGGSTYLPGATTAMQQVLVDTTNNNLVTVTVCWQAPKDPVPRQHVVTASIS